MPKKPDKFGTPVSSPRRLTEAGLLELTLALAQYWYYERDQPIMTDADYDQLEQYYKQVRKESPGGVHPGILDTVGSSANLMHWLLRWRELP